MRIIAGQARGRKFKAPAGLRTRPAPARARASIFSRLEASCELKDLCVLDIFAGSGSLGIEALSRGAESATFVDSSRAATAAIRANLDKLGLSRRGRVITADFRRALATFQARRALFDLVFVDAPYRNDVSAEVLARLARMDLVASGGRVVVRQSRRASAPAPAAAGFQRFKLTTIGDHRIAFYRRSDDDSAGEGNTSGQDD